MVGIFCASESSELIGTIRDTLWEPHIKHMACWKIHHLYTWWVVYLPRVSWDDYPIYCGKIRNVPNQQPETVDFPIEASI